MKKSLLFVFLLLEITLFVSAQSDYKLTGIVIDDHNSPLNGASIILNNGEISTITDKKGLFVFKSLDNENYSLFVSFIGYTNYSQTINPSVESKLRIKLSHHFEQLEEVIIKDNYSDRQLHEEARNIVIVDQQFLKQNLAGSLMKSLERLPGVSSIEIGSGQSKPVIRGLSFNRLIVNENGIKHEGQQWGADHGLEIDQYSVERVEIIKGPASLMYGSDAIGGVINLSQSFTPTINSYGGSVDITGKSNNNALETSVYTYARKKEIYLKARLTLADYGDYKVPVDFVTLNDWNIPLTGNFMRNTAGNEKNFHFTAGIIKDRLNSQLIFSKLHSKSGLFANAAGIEPRTSDSSFDLSNRDIMNPFQEVSHLKLIHKTVYYYKQGRLETELGYQNNFRQEMNNYYSHGFMPNTLPAEIIADEFLEREFNKSTLTGNAQIKNIFKENHHYTIGINMEHQENDIGGRGFIIPAFNRFTTGLFLYDKYILSEKIIFHVGLRYDYGHIETRSYTDWYASQIINGSDTSIHYIERAISISKNYDNVSWALGLNYNLTHFSFKLNLGKSFRMPIAKELAANGVNYHYFRYEKGSSSLSAEESYQIDAGAEWNYEKFALQLSPFVNYFPNYIYLNPSFEHDYLYGAGNQIFYYTQSKVFRAGSEMHAHYCLATNLKAGLIAEYIYSIQLSGEKKCFGLPFSPPLNLLLNLKYSPYLTAFLKDPVFLLDVKLVTKQDNIVPPEKKTPAYQIVNLSFGTGLDIYNSSINLNFQVRNLFNKTYWNHTSFYRIIGVPGLGRSFVLSIKIPFNNKNKQS